MKSQVFSLKNVSHALELKSYQVVYALTSGYVPEPQQVGNRRLFTLADIERLAEHFGVGIDLTLLKESEL